MSNRIEAELKLFHFLFCSHVCEEAALLSAQLCSESTNLQLSAMLFVWEFAVVHLERIEVS